MEAPPVEEATSQPEAEKPPIKETSNNLQQPSAPSSQKSLSPNRTPNQLSKEESMDDENMDLDFEEISEDELEEETRVKGLGDALGVDWASLVAESRPRVKPVSSAKKRWESHNVLVNLGISVEMTGEDLAKEIFREHALAKKEEELEVSKVKEENLQSELNGVVIKQEIKEEPAEPQENVEVEIPHPIAAVQVAMQENRAVRKALFSSAGPFRRALCARRDLAIRRHLSHLPVEDDYVEVPKRHDPELLKVALQLFERCL